MPEQTITVELTIRELTLIRAACLQRLARLIDKPAMQNSYDETRALLNGKLWEARKALTPSSR